MKAVHIDGVLVFAVGFLGALATEFSADSVFHYVDATCVFWIKASSASLAAGCVALIGFRSKTYARYSDAKAITEAEPGISSVDTQVKTVTNKINENQNPTPPVVS